MSPAVAATAGRGLPRARNALPRPSACASTLRRDGSVAATADRRAGPAPRRPRVWIASGLLGCWVAAAASAAEMVWLDFETKGLATDWNAPQGGLAFEIVPGPAGGGAPGPALRLNGGPKGFLYTRKAVLPEILTNEIGRASCRERV